MTDPYNEGLRARRYTDNPYEENTEAYDLFERGFTQRIKRLPPEAIDRFFNDEDQETIEAEIKKSLKSYKEAKDGF